MRMTQKICISQFPIYFGLLLLLGVIRSYYRHKKVMTAHASAGTLGDSARLNPYVSLQQ